MSKEMYNLQVPIEKSLADALKRLASIDDRTLRSYCRKILQNHVAMEEGISSVEVETNSVETEINNVIESEQPVKIKKVGKLTKR